MDRPYTKYPRAVLWLLEQGEFTLGDASLSDAPPRQVSIPAFYISTTPITNVQFEAFQPEFVRSPLSRGDDDPAAGVSFREAAGYCEWYARIARKPIRLPTEAEWEYACRGKTTTRYFFGDDADDVAIYACTAESGATVCEPAQSRKANPLGLYGMLGNVWEWTSSRYLPYDAQDDTTRDDLTTEDDRVLRGGSFRTPIADAWCATRRAVRESVDDPDVGFRIVREFPRR